MATSWTVLPGMPRVSVCMCILMASAALLCQGCATLPRVRHGLEAAGRDPRVWAPLAAAALFQVDDFDRRTADWARDKTPVFGSQGNAENWSDGLRASTGVLAFATLLAAPNRTESGTWIAEKARDAIVDASAIAGTSLVTGTLKSAADRERPDGSDRESLPSGHASSAAVMSRLANIHLQSIEMRDDVRRVAGVGIDLVAIGTGWARVEAGVHFPSDVLVGLALGNFLANFAARTFLDPPPGNVLSVAANGDGVFVGWAARF